MAETPKKPGRGFAALGEWVSDVEKDVGAVVGTTAPSPQAKAEPPLAAQATRAEQAPPPSTGRSGTRGGTGLLKNIWIGIALWSGAILLLAIIRSAILKPASPVATPPPVVAEQPKPVAQPAQAPSVRWSAPPPGMVWEDEKRRMPAVTEVEEAEAEEEAVADAEEEVIPPMGRSNTLGPAEVRYCVCEKIRLEGMDQEVDTSSEAEVDAYNEAVDDYNARCGSFRYRRGLLERIQEAAEERRFTLEQEGAQRLDLVR